MRVVTSSLVALIVAMGSAVIVFIPSQVEAKMTSDFKSSPPSLPFPFNDGIHQNRGGSSTLSSTTSQGKDEKATGSLDVSIPLSQSSSLSKNDAPLMRDIEMLNDILSDIVQKEDMTIHQLVEEFLDYGRER